MHFEPIEAPVPELGDFSAHRLCQNTNKLTVFSKQVGVGISMIVADKRDKIITAVLIAAH